MKKLISIFLAGLMAFSLSVAMDTNTIKEKIEFPHAEIVDTISYSHVIMKNAKYLHTSGYPILPYYTKTYTFPLGTKINSIEVNVNGIEHINLDKKIAPAPPAVPRGMENGKYEVREGEIYSQDTFYPDAWYDYHIGVGIYNEERVVFLNIYFYPLKYNAVRNEAMYAKNFEVKIDYKEGKSTLTMDTYDLLIIAPEKFVDGLQPLKEEKEKHGIKTVIETVEDIKSNYNGRDDAEKVKYAIKDAIEEYGIKYVLLVGGLSSPIKSDTWLVPVRYSHLDDGEEDSYLTDLYFADVYKYEDGNIVFDDWDSNGNGIFAEWSMRGKDILDLHPDVYVGRLACRSEKELKTVVNKIISYENTADDSWFKKVVLVGGDTFNDINGNNYLEGEIANQKVAEILDDFESEKIWWSENEVNQKNVVNAIGKGCGFVHLSGHGSPAAWFVKDFIKNPNGKYIWALDVYHFPLLKNGDKLPIVVIGGCHNSMFNTSLYKSAKEVITTIIVKYILQKHYTTWYWIPAPESMGWWFVKQEGGGAIATFGCTGLGLGTIGDSNKDGIPDCIQYLLTWLELRFFKVYKNGTDVLGEAWGNAINDYINEFLSERQSQRDVKTVQEWVLLGDPTLKIGGYE